MSPFPSRSLINRCFMVSLHIWTVEPWFRTHADVREYSVSKVDVMDAWKTGKQVGIVDTSEVGGGSGVSPRGMLFAPNFGSFFERSFYFSLYVSVPQGIVDFSLIFWVQFPSYRAFGRVEIVAVPILVDSSAYTFWGICWGRHDGEPRKSVNE